MRRIAGFFGGGSFLTFALGPAAVLVLALRSARPASASSVVLDFFTIIRCCCIVLSHFSCYTLRTL